MFNRISQGFFSKLIVKRWVIIDNGCESEEAVCLFELLQCAAADLLAFLNFALVLLAGHLLLLLLPVQLLQNHPPLLLLQSDLLQQSLLLDFVALELRLPPSLLLSLVLLDPSLDFNPIFVPNPKLFFLFCLMVSDFSLTIVINLVQ
jgi:hypothetical protein